MKNIQVIGRQWFDKINGNTYHSVDVYQNNKLIGSESFQYGYDDGYKQTAFSILCELGIYSKKRRENGSYIDYYKFTREDNILFSVSDVSRRKDL